MASQFLSLITPPQLIYVIRCHCKAQGKKCCTEACGYHKELLSATVLVKRAAAIHILRADQEDVQMEDVEDEDEEGDEQDGIEMDDIEDGFNQDGEGQ